ncbi:hypothetical protein [Sphingomonas sp.]|jgi:hypothetical protein|uniref:hypothetical protein n=1 Tax=Sphingomonas sp. TaxID=28214 RepID=UPI002D801C3D|nr:hypothetical protein [Sphingomonas sp.]HEU0043851.1 hypothetical protein [Sphingomonas sp.]
MSAGSALVEAVLAELRHEELQPLVVFDAPPVRAGLPYAVIEEPVLKSENAAGVQGRTGMLAISFHDDGERPLPLRGMVAFADELIALLPTEIGEGWRIGGLALARSRLTRTKEGWTARSEWSVRMFRAVAEP